MILLHTMQVRTLFVSGLPDDLKQRELNILFHSHQVYIYSLLSNILYGIKIIYATCKIM